MWSIEQLEDIRDACLADIADTIPNMADQISAPRIEIDHRSKSTLARYSASHIRISAYLLSSTTTSTFFRTLIMKVLIQSQLRLQESDLAFVQLICILQEKYPRKYDFEEYKDKIEVPQDKTVYRYAVRCPQCGQVFRYKRLCKTVISPQNYICTKCKVSLERLC